MQNTLDRHVTPGYFAAHALAADVGVDRECEVEHRGSFRQFLELTVGGKDKHLLVVEIESEFTDCLAVIHLFALQHLAHALEELVHSGFALSALVFPVRCHTFLGHFVHALSSNLHFNPFVFRAENSSMQRLIAVGLGDRQPVTQTLGVGLVHICHHGISLPALGFLFLGCRVEDDTNGEQVVDTIHPALLLLHLIVDGMDGLGASFDMELQAERAQFFLHRANEGGDVGVTLLFLGIQRVRNLFIYSVIGELERQVLQFCFDYIQTQTVSQGGVEE